MNNNKIKRMVGIAILSAIVVVLQLLGSFIKIGPVSICLVLVPIVVGAATYGPAAGAILGGVFSIVVLCQPDTNAFYQVSVLGTVLTVVVKGVLSGYLAGLTFQLASKKNVWLGVILAAIVAPVINTGIFFIGCRVFFWNTLASWGQGNALNYMLTVMIGFNFLAELGTNVVCSPIICRFLKAAKH